MSERNIFLSEKQKKFTDMDKFYECSQEVVMKRKEYKDKTNVFISILPPLGGFIIIGKFY